MDFNSKGICWFGNIFLKLESKFDAAFDRAENFIYEEAKNVESRAQTVSLRVKKLYEEVMPQIISSSFESHVKETIDPVFSIMERADDTLENPKKPLFKEKHHMQKKVSIHKISKENGDEISQIFKSAVVEKFSVQKKLPVRRILENKIGEETSIKPESVTVENYPIQKKLPIQDVLMKDLDTKKTHHVSVSREEKCLGHTNSTFQCLSSMIDLDTESTSSIPVSSHIFDVNKVTLTSLDNSCYELPLKEIIYKSVEASKSKEGNTRKDSTLESSLKVKNVDVKSHGKECDQVIEVPPLSSAEVTEFDLSEESDAQSTSILGSMGKHDVMSNSIPSPDSAAAVVTSEKKEAEVRPTPFSSNGSPGVDNANTVLICPGDTQWGEMTGGYDDTDLWESCIVVDPNELCFFPSVDKKCSISHKKNIQDVLTFKIGSGKQQKYNQLAEHCMEVDAEIKRARSLKLPTGSNQSELTKLSDYDDICDSDWEFL